LASVAEGVSLFRQLENGLEDVRPARDRSCNQQKAARANSGSKSERALSKVADAQRASPASL
jgi:hypothetical protein